MTYLAEAAAGKSLQVSLEVYDVETGWVRIG